MSKFRRAARPHPDHRLAGAALGALSVLVAAAPAHAYVGPGAGLTAIGTILAVLGALLLALVGFVWYPIKRVLRRKTAAPPPPRSDATSGPAADERP